MKGLDKVISWIKKYALLEVRKTEPGKING